MKKIFLSLLTIAMLFVLSACIFDSSDSDDDSTTTTTTPTTETTKTLEVADFVEGSALQNDADLKGYYSDILFEATISSRAANAAQNVGAKYQIELEKSGATAITSASVKIGSIDSAFQQDSDEWTVDIPASELTMAEGVATTMVFKINGTDYSVDVKRTYEPSVIAFSPTDWDPTKELAISWTLATNNDFQFLVHMDQNYSNSKLAKFANTIRQLTVKANVITNSDPKIMLLQQNFSQDSGKKLTVIYQSYDQLGS